MKYPSPTASRADLTLATDYYPFGSAMPGRSFSEGEYRYGFQGQEKDDELKGEGNSINYKYRMHDARVGRFFAVDPLAYEFPWNSPYAFSENVVIDHIELEGLDKIKVSEHRRKPKISNRVDGGGLPSIFGGLRGKYLRHSLINHNPQRLNPGSRPPDPGKDPLPCQNPNPTNDLDEHFDNRNPFDLPMPFGNQGVEMLPRYREGTLESIYEPEEGSTNNSKTMSVGIIDKDGNMRDIRSYELDGDTTIKYDFKLKRGEHIVIIRDGTGKTTTGATRPEPKSDKK
jgi:RHS repeat-associated protein